jgi:hypothetical protein
MSSWHRDHQVCWQGVADDKTQARTSPSRATSSTLFWWNSRTSSLNRRGFRHRAPTATTFACFREPCRWLFAPTGYRYPSTHKSELERQFRTMLAPKGSSGLAPSPPRRSCSSRKPTDHGASASTIASSIPSPPRTRSRSRCSTSCSMN